MNWIIVILVSLITGSTQQGNPHHQQSFLHYNNEYQGVINVDNVIISRYKAEEIVAIITVHEIKGSEVDVAGETLTHPHCLFLYHEEQCNIKVKSDHPQCIHKRWIRPLQIEISKSKGGGPNKNKSAHVGFKLFTCRIHKPGVNSTNANGNAQESSSNHAVAPTVISVILALIIVVIIIFVVIWKRRQRFTSENSSEMSLRINDSLEDDVFDNGGQKIPSCSTAPTNDRIYTEIDDKETQQNEIY